MTGVAAYPEIYGASLCSGVGALDLAVSLVLDRYKCILHTEREAGAGGGRGICETGNAVDDADGAKRRPRGESGNSRIEGLDTGRQADSGTGIAEPLLADANERDDERGSVGNANLTGLERRSMGEQPEGGPAERERSGEHPVFELADTLRERQQDSESTPCDEEAHGSARWIELEPDSHNESSGYGAGCGPSDLPIFAPGPGSTAEWLRILRDRPWLAPAISEEEIERILCGKFAGDAFQLDFEDRTDRLRSLGNLAQPLQAAFAIATLARRLLK